MKSIQTFIVTEVVSKIENFIKEVNSAGLPAASSVVTIAKACEKRLNELAADIEALKGQSLNNESVMNKIISTFSDVQSSLQRLNLRDEKSIKLVKDLMSHFNDRFYENFESAIKGEIRDTVGRIAAAMIPTSMVISGIKSGLRADGVEGNDYKSFMQNLFNKSFFNPLRAKIATAERRLTEGEAISRPSIF